MTVPKIFTSKPNWVTRIYTTPVCELIITRII